MPNVSLAKVSLNRALMLGIRLPSSGDMVPEADPTRRRPGWSNGLGNLILIVAPIAPDERAASGDFMTSISLTKSAPTELKSKARPTPDAILRLLNSVSLKFGPKPRTVTWVAVPTE